MSNAQKSLQLMRLLQPFTQTGVIKPVEAKEIVDSYQKGDSTKLKDLTNDPRVPMGFNGLCQKLAEFI